MEVRREDVKHQHIIRVACLLRDRDHLLSGDCVLIRRGKNDLAVGSFRCLIPVCLRIIIGVIPYPRVGSDNTPFNDRIQIDGIILQHFRHFAEVAFNPLLDLLVACAILGELIKILCAQLHHGAVSRNMVLFFRSIILR